MKRGNRRYLVLLLLILGLMGGYTAYWFYALGKAKEAFAATVASERAAGNTFDYSAIEWGGFPVRIGATISGLKYRGRGTEIEADTLMAEVLPWNPAHALVRADGNVRLASRVPDRVEWIEFRPTTLISSLRFTFGGLLEGADLEMRQVRSDGTDFDGNDFSFNAARLQFDTVYMPTADMPLTKDSHDGADVAFSADQLMISEGFAPALGPKISTIRMAGHLAGLPVLAGGAAGDIKAVTLAIARLDFDWGGVSAKGTGALALDAATRPEGHLDFKIIGLGKLISALEANGTLQAPPGAEMLPDVPGGTPIALQIKQGLVTFGSFTVGEVPSFD